MALRQWRQVEEELKKTIIGGDPRILRCIGEMYERHRVQHEQMMQLATAVNTLTDKFTDVISAANHLRGIVEKSGLTQKMGELEGDPDETGSTHDMFRDIKKN
jgi:hypothetical protein